MKICWIKIGGWPEAFDERAEAMAQHVEKLVLIKPENKAATGTLEEIPNLEIIRLKPSRNPILQSRLKVLAYPFWMLQAIIVYLLWSLQNGRCDIIHSIDPSMSAPSSTILSILTQTPLVVSVRGLHITQQSANESKHSTSLSWWVVTQILHYIKAKTFQEADYVITKSPHQQEYLAEEYKYPTSRIKVIPTGVDFNLFNPSQSKDDTVLQEIVTNLSKSDRTVLYLGRLTRSKGVIEFVENIAANNFEDNIQFVMIGKFENDELQSEIRRIISDNNIEETVTIYPKWVSFDKVPDLIASVDTVCLLSEPGVEGVPRILQEACVMETSIVGNKVEGIKEIFESFDGCYLIDRNNPDDFRKAILNSFDTTPDREVFKDIFDIHLNYNKYKRIYRNLISHTNNDCEESIMKHDQD